MAWSNLVHIAYKHNAPQLIKSINIHPLAIVTAAVDRIGACDVHLRSGLLKDSIC